VSTLLRVNEGVFRAAPAGGRGRKRRRGEFTTITDCNSAGLPAEFPTTNENRGADVGFPTESVELRVSEEHDSDSRITLRMRGTLELATVLPFREAVFAALGQHPTSLILDLHGVDVVDTAGISALVTVSRVARLLSVPCNICAAPGCYTAMEAMGVGRVLAGAMRAAVQ